MESNHAPQSPGARPAAPPHSAYDRRGSSRRPELPEPTHELMALRSARRGGVTVNVPGWLVQLLTVLCSAAFALGVARAELSGKAEKGEVRAVDQKLERVLDLLCAREPQPQPRACTQPTPAP